MKKNNGMFKRLFAGLLTVCMMLATTPFSVFAEDGITTPIDSFTEQTVGDPETADIGWTQDPVTAKGSEICTVTEDGWLHLASCSDNGNATTGENLPAIFVSDDMEFADEGYIQFTMKSTSPSTDRFGIYLGYTDANNGLFIGYDNSGWFWQKYDGSTNEWYSGTRVATPTANTETTVRIEWSNRAFTLTVGGTAVFTNESFDGLTNLGKGVAIKCGSYATSNEVTDVYIKDISSSLKTVQPEVTDFTYGDVDSDGGVNSTDATLVLQKYAGILASADFNENAADVNSDNQINSTDATLILQYYAGIISKFPADTSSDIPNPDIADDADAVVLKTADMEVQVDSTFPRVHKYTMLGANAGKEIAGQTDELSTITINNADLTPQITSSVSDDKTKITYTIPCKDITNNIDCVLTAVIEVKDNTLSLQFTDIKNNLNNEVYPVKTIDIPNHSLVSVQSNQQNANLMANVISSITYRAGDTYMELTDDTQPMSTSYSYAVISNNELSASVESNTLYERSGAGLGYGGMTDGNNTRVAVNVENKGDCKSLSLASSPWVYDTFLSSYDGENTKTFVEYYDKENDMPYVKVVVTGDENEDGEVNWNDGAIAFRSISHYIEGSEYVPDRVTYRIAMNFGGQAQNPFLTTLDNVKKVALHTEGIGQAILLKGYGNEGHDSGHPDYADIGERIGGAEDMVTLLDEGKEYGAYFGIHINASEMYPEADAFSEEMVKRNNDSDKSLSYGWNWIDQGIGINGIFDLTSGERMNRFQQLYDIVGNKLDFIYLDVWGNATSGNEGTVTTRNIGEQITSFGWRMGNEWGTGFDWNATMQHWAADLAYGGNTSKGHNSVLMRFIRNSEKDSWVADCPSYGGAANAPLLGGMEMYDFEGWQGRNDYDEYIRTVYSHNITTKFVQHFDCTKWVNSENSYEVEGYDWYPEMYIELKDEAGNLVTLTRGSDDVNSSAYRDRTITYNGVVVSKGACTTGATSVSQRITGTETYLIPWFWSADSTVLEDSEQKLYHWNCQGGTTTWELIDEWKDCQTVTVYKLTDLGKTDMQEVAVVDGKITITADAETPYVVYKGEKAQIDVKWSEGMHLYDVGFNSGSLTAWAQVGTGSATIAKSQYSNPMLKLDGTIALTQTLTDLQAGAKYAIYVGVDNRSDNAATITLKDSNGNVIDTNYTDRSIAKNYIKAYAHSTSSATENGTSYFQNMYIYFTAPTDGSDVTITLSHTGDGHAYFDDIRVLENNFTGITKDADGNVIRFENDFENNAQGVYPFVIGGVEWVEDNRTHLSEKNAPYTQAGWDVKKLDDVIDGNWSIKVNGLVQKNNLVMQTIPQNFRFEPNVTYTVSFDYQLGSDGTYVVALGNGEYTSLQDSLYLEKTLDTNVVAGQAKTNKCVFTITGAENGQTWFGIYSTGVAAEVTGISGSEANFGGYKDIIIDNLVITRNDADSADRTAINAKIAEASNLDSRDYEEATWSAMQSKLTTAKAVVANLDATKTEIDTACAELTTAISNLVRVSCTISGKVVSNTGTAIANATVILKADGEQNRSTKTNANGEYSFADIPIRNYTALVTASGYVSKYNVAITVNRGQSNQANIVMNAKSGDYDYTNEFDSAETITGIENLTGNTSRATISFDNTNKAVKLQFPGGGRNNVVLADAGTFVNAKIEFDLTPSGSSTRFGVVFRANNMNERIFVGLGDSNNQYFGEHWNGSTNSWTSMHSGTSLVAGTKYHITAELNGNTVKFYVDGELMCSETISGITTNAGYVGFECRDGATFTIDNIKITDLYSTN